jgi:6-pyruvoyltetrahydropterin/6-carboxytetrahydropterin synthase
MPRVFKLTRETRFAVGPKGQPLPDGKNGFAGRPALGGLGFYFELRVTLVGDLDPASSYLRNIKDVDDNVRRRAIPIIGSAIAEDSFGDGASVMRQLLAELRRADPPWNLHALELRLSPYLSLSVLASEPDMIRLSQKFEFSAAHRLHNPALSSEQNVLTFGKCNNPLGHGHNYEVQVTIASPMPVHELERVVDQTVIDSLDHKHLNIEVPAFKELNPSVENIAMVIYKKLKPALSSLASVTVWETPKTWCEYSE